MKTFKHDKVENTSNNYQGVRRSVERQLDADFNQQHLAEISFPDVQLATISEKEQVPYMVFGNPDAEKLIFVVTPYGNTVDDPSQMVRMTAQQEILGDEYCVVGLHVEDTAGMKLSHKQRRKVSDGDFEPFADRVLAVIEAVDPQDDQEVYFYGYSKGADVAVETTHKLATSEHGGIVEIDGIAVNEISRTRNVGALTVASAFASSGKDLHENVLQANSPALLEARGIDPSNPKAKKLHDKAVMKQVVKNYMKDPLGGVANMKGFGTDASFRQLQDLDARGQLPSSTVVGRADRTTLFDSTAFRTLARIDGIDTFEFSGDHSAGDNTTTSAALMAFGVGVRLR